MPSKLSHDGWPELPSLAFFAWLCNGVRKRARVNESGSVADGVDRIDEFDISILTCMGFYKMLRFFDLAFAAIEQFE